MLWEVQGSVSAGGNDVPSDLNSFLGHGYDGVIAFWSDYGWRVGHGVVGTDAEAVFNAITDGANCYQIQNTAGMVSVSHHFNIISLRWDRSGCWLHSVDTLKTDVGGRGLFRFLIS